GLFPASFPRLRPRRREVRHAGLQGQRQAHRAGRPVDVLLPGVPEVMRPSSAMLAGVWRFAAVGTGVCFPAVAAAEPARRVNSHAAQDGVAYGFVGNFSAATAQAAALDTCRRMSNTQRTVASCRIAGMFTDQCFAIALVPQGGATTLAW